MSCPGCSGQLRVPYSLFVHSLKTVLYKMKNSEISCLTDARNINEDHTSAGTKAAVSDLVRTFLTPFRGTDIAGSHQDTIFYFSKYIILASGEEAFNQTFMFPTDPREPVSLRNIIVLLEQLLLKFQSSK